MKSFWFSSLVCQSILSNLAWISSQIHRNNSGIFNNFVNSGKNFQILFPLKF